MAKVVCDKCKQPVEQMLATDVHRQFTTTGHKWRYYLCPGCTNKFADWCDEEEVSWETTDEEVDEMVRLSRLLNQGYSICEECGEVFKLPDEYDETDDQLDRVLMATACPKCYEKLKGEIKK